MFSFCIEPIPHMISVGDEGNKQMKKIKNSFWMLALLIVAALALSSCTPAATPTAAPAEPTAGAAPATTAPAVAPAEATAVIVPTAGSEPVVGGKKILRVAYTREIDVLNAFTSQNLCDIEFTMVEGLVQNNE
ncbi:MAG TPA: hypothetical protein VGM23_06865, partial [Armatimonadota bacterium]